MFPYRALLALTLSAGLAAAADPALLQLVMKDPHMVAGLDIDRAKNSPFGQKILGEMKDEDAGFQKFVASTGFDPRRDLREVVLASKGASKGENTLIAVRGSFDPGRIARFLESEGGVAASYRGVEVWKGGKKRGEDGAFAFLDSSVALFGTEAMVKEAIDRRQAGGLAMGGEMAARVNDWSARHDAWFVSSAALAVMGIGKSGNNALLPGGISMDSIKQANAGVRFGNVVELSGELMARSDKDATALGDILRFLASMVRLNADKPGMEEALKIADSLQVSTSGDRMRFSLSMTEEQLEKMLDSKGRGRSRPAARRGPEVI